MPELPEVETVRTQLQPALAGHAFVRVDICDPRLVESDDPWVVAHELEGERVRRVERRGKYLAFRFESNRTLLSHLRMTGAYRLSTGTDAALDHRHTRAAVRLDDGRCLTYRDIRRFGTWRLLKPDELQDYLSARLGVEPLESDFTSAWLAERLARRRAPLKTVLLDQRVVAGLGNIYADEALWRAALHPLRQASGLRPAEVQRLHRAVRAALREGIARGGSTLRDYRAPDGAEGAMQREFRVYGRAGEPCDRCALPILKTRVGGRGTSLCAACQPAPAAA